MRIDKIYLDVIAENGAGAIGYATRARIGGIGPSPAVWLSWNADTDTAPAQSRARHVPFPLRDPTRVTWPGNPFSVSAVWTRPAPPWREQLLWQDGDTSARWQVLAPCSPVTLSVDTGALAGHGYAEILRLEGSPWRLPIDTLRWGRFVSATRNVTWIVWEHKKETRRWLWNDRDTPERAVDLGPGGVAWERHRLDWENHRTLRSGKIGGTVFHALRGVEKILPRWMRAIDETKWLARGRLTGPNGLDDTGWVIHETVRLR